MSLSPPIRRRSSASSSSREDLINQYEAEEERIINVLSRKLEQLREEKIDLENALEAESEAHVNRLSREISALRAQQQLAQANGSGVVSPTDLRAPLMNGRHPEEPSAEIMLDAMRRENEQLRNRLVDTERDYVRITRLNEVYREELIEHRRRLGLPVDNLIGLSSVDPYSQSTHRRSMSNTSSPSTSIVLPSPPYTHSGRPINGVPIPRPPSQIHRPAPSASSTTTPLSHSPSSSSSSPYPFSPSPISPMPASYATQFTTPPSSASLASNPVTYGPAGATRALSYPSVPPPSLSSSFGSPTASFHLPPPHSGAPPSPADSWRAARAFGRPGSGSRPGSHSRRESVERGARVAETGSLLPRGRRESLAVPVEDADTPVAESGENRMPLGT